MRKNYYANGLKLILLGVVLVSISSNVFGQLEEYERSQKLKYLDLGIRQYENGQFKEADESFRQVLETVKVLPAEICFYFGANSFFLNKYKQSINWLNKYIALKGTSGQYFEECTKFLEKAEEKYLQASTQEKSEEVYAPRNDTDYTVMPKIDCGPSGKVVCPVCKGETVIIKKTHMSYEYRSCPWCDNHGNLTCDEYNLLLLGELKPRAERALN